MSESSATVNPEPSTEKPPSVRLSITCKYCTRDVSRNFHIICAEPVCVNSKGGVRLCGDCLHLSIATHSPSHPYTVVDCMQIPIFSKDWTILEELVLLAGIEKHGMGNWKTIGESMGLGRTARQIEEHYFEKYMGVHGYCLPAKTVLHNKQSPNLTAVGAKLQFVETEATFFSKPSRDGSKMDEPRSEATATIPSDTNEESATATVGSEQSQAVADDKPSETSVSNVEVAPDQKIDEPNLMALDASKEEAQVSDQPEEAADAIPEEDDGDEFPAGAVVSGCRIQVTQGYTRGTTVLRDAEVDRALSGYAFSDGVDTTMLTLPQSSVKAGGPTNTEASVRERLTQLPGADLPGFIPLREDFDVEHANDAELLLAEMEFNVSDHPSERELKLQVVRIYNEKLEERNRRKRFVIDRGLIDMKQLQMQERRRTKEEREFVGRLRPIGRFNSVAEHEALVEGVLRARRLKMQIELYAQYRAMGIRTLEQARLYEIDKRNRQKDQKLRKHREGATHIFGAQSETDKSGVVDDLISILGKRSRRREQLSAFDVAAGMVCEMSREDEEEEFEASTTVAKVSKETPLPPPTTEKRRGRKPNALKQIVAVAADNDEDYDDEEDRPSLISSSTRRRRGNDENNDEGLEKNTLRRRNSSYPNLTKESTADDAAKTLSVVTGAQGAELLTDQEVQLCAMVPMLPLHYLAAKEAIVREAYRNGSLTQDGLQRVFVSNSDQVSRTVCDFFVRELRLNEPNPVLQRPTTSTTATAMSTSADSTGAREGDLTQSEPMQVAEDMS